MIKSISEAQLFEKDILIRVDLNVPFQRDHVSDPSRMISIIPTVKLILEKGGRPILMSHFGQPKGVIDRTLSLRKILSKLIQILKKEVIFCEHLDSEAIKTFINKTPKHKIILLENTRFFEGEENNSSKLSEIFSQFGDLFCNDAFSASHRTHASIVGITNKLPSYSGLLLEREILTLNNALLYPKTPVTAIVGGSKVSTKIPILKNLVQKVNHIVIGGGMANTFIYAQNKKVGKSLFEKDLVPLCQEILITARALNCQIHLPIDIVCASELKEEQTSTTHDVNACPSDKMILDAGPETVANIFTILKKSKTLIWNGPLGAFEIVPFDKSTQAVATIVASLTKKKKLLSIAGGGDTLSALNSANLTDKFSYVSNAGGAFLKWMEGKKLPGIAALEKNI